MTAGEGAVDRDQLRALLVAYWRIMRRGRAAGMLASGGGSGSLGTFPLALTLYGVLGALIGAMLVEKGDAVVYGFALHAFTVIVCGMALTLESGEILFSRVERDVLGHRPVSPATLLLAKGIHLFAFGLLLAGAANAIPAFIGLGLKGARPWFPVAHLAAVAGQTAFLCASVVFVYGAVARLVGRERFEAAATWAQVGASVVFVVGYQLTMPLLVNLGDRVTLHPALLLTPPGWFAAFGAILGGAGTRVLLPGAAAGVLVTSALSWVAVRRLSAGYADRVAAADEAFPRPNAAARARAGGRFDAVIRFWLRDPVERAAFRLAAAYMGRDREMKQRLYPSLAGFLVIPLMGIISPGRGPRVPILALVSLGMLGVVAVSVEETLRVSSQHAAANVFRAAPLESAWGLFEGVRKAAFVFVVLPAGLVVTAFVVFAIPGGRADMIAGIPMLLLIPTVSLLPGLVDSYVPLSKPVVHGEVAGRTAVLMFFGMLLTGVLGVVGFLASRADAIIPVVVGELAVLGLVHVAASKAIRSRPFPAD
jgi:ABC-2 type transport system permease protein